MGNDNVGACAPTHFACLPLALRIMHPNATRAITTNTKSIGNYKESATKTVDLLTLADAHEFADVSKSHALIQDRDGIAERK